MKRLSVETCAACLRSRTRLTAGFCISRSAFDSGGNYGEVPVLFGIAAEVQIKLCFDISHEAERLLQTRIDMVKAVSITRSAGTGGSKLEFSEPS